MRGQGFENWEMRNGNWELGIGNATRKSENEEMGEDEPNEGYDSGDAGIGRKKDNSPER